jgi:hypothetical protein
MKPPESCPICGVDVPRNAKACPECGACERSGWSDDATLDGLGLPDDEFDYGKFAEDEFGGKRRIKPRGLSWVWWVAGILALVGFVLLFLLRP